MPVDTVPLLAALFVVPGASFAEPMEIGFDVSGIVVDDVVGTGQKMEEGDVVTFHYHIVDAQGKVLADSERRGLAFTATEAELTPESSIVGALRGVKVGGIRRLITDTDAIGLGGNLLIPKGTPIEVRVRVLAIGRPTNPMVD